MKNEIIYEKGMSAEDFVNVNNTHLSNHESINKDILKKYFPKALEVLSNLGNLTVGRIYAIEGKEKSLFASCSFFANGSQFRAHNKYLQGIIGNSFERIRKISDESTSRMHAYRLGRFLEGDEKDPFDDLYVALAMFKSSQ